jgi:Domain of unknown function (DUF4333)
MQPLDDLNPIMSPERPAVTSRWLGRSLIAGVLVAASVLFTACGSSGAPTILNTEKVERAIEHSTLAQRGKLAQVSCPSGVHQRKGLVFSCTAVVQRRSTRFVVTQLNGVGQVHYEAR